MAHRLVELEDLIEEAKAALVVRQRSRGEPLKALAPILDLSEDRLRKKYVPQAVDEQLVKRSRPRRTRSGPSPGKSADANAPAFQRLPAQRMASALTRMKNGSGRRQREIAQALEVDDSYVSRMLSGERFASWRHVRVICEVCDGDEQLMKPLWQVAAGVPPADSDDRVGYLRTYLKALRYANGWPSEQTILASAQDSITLEDLRQAFDGPGVPGWPVVAQLTAALQALPETARPLWRRAQSATDT
ncbi:helix-turn-helix domain-containing protein [Streptomyces sp. NPDC002640]